MSHGAEGLCPHPLLFQVYADPNGRWKCETCGAVLAMRDAFSFPSVNLRLGSCCVKVGTDECVCERPTPDPLPIHRTEAGYPYCSTCDGGGCLDCTDPA